MGYKLDNLANLPYNKKSSKLLCELLADEEKLAKEEDKELHHQDDMMDLRDQTLNWFNVNLFANDNLGFDVSEDKKIPDGKTMPRLFLLHRGEDGGLRPMSLEDAHIKPNSREFWKEAQKGNLFAFPSGKKDPIQIMATKPAGGRPNIIFSDPITDLTQIDPEAPKPNFLKRLLNGINKNWFRSLSFRIFFGNPCIHAGFRTFAPNNS